MAIIATAQITVATILEPLTYDGEFVNGVELWSESSGSYSPVKAGVVVKASPESLYGGNLLDITGTKTIYAREPQKIETDKVYDLTFRVKQNTGNNVVNFGFIQLNENKLPVTSGADAAGHKLQGADISVTAGSGWHIYQFKFASRTSPPSGIVAIPTAVKYILPFFIVNKSSNSGEALVDCLKFEDISVKHDLETNLANKVDNTALSVFNALTNNGSIQGIFAEKDPHDNITKFYINGEYINAKNLSVTNAQGTKTLMIDNNGDVSLNVHSFNLSAGGASNIYTKTETETHVSTAVSNLKIGGRNYVKDSSVEKIGSNEFLSYTDLAPIFDTIGLKQYTLSFDIMTPKDATVTVYCQNGSSTKYNIGQQTVHSTTTYTRQHVSFTPTLSDTTQTQALLSFFGTYGTGAIPHVKNVKLELGNVATDWTPAPEDNSVDNLHIGGRNYVLDSGQTITNQNYMIHKYELSNERFKEGDLVTVQIKGTLGPGKTSWAVYNSGDRIPICGMNSTTLKNGIYTMTVPWRIGGTSNDSIWVHAMEQPPSGVTSTIEWIKIERGSVGTDWTPAPEDINSKITDAHNLASSADNKINNLQIGARNLIRGTKNFVIDGTEKFGFSDNTNGRGHITDEEGFGVATITSTGNANQIWASYISSRFDATKGDIIAFSCYFKSPNLSAINNKNIASINFYNASNTRVEQLDISIPSYVTENNKWYRISGFKECTNTTAVKGSIQVHLAQNGTVQFKECKAEKGNHATDWTPAPEDSNDLQLSDIQIGGRNLIIDHLCIPGFINADNGSINGGATNEDDFYTNYFIDVTPGEKFVATIYSDVQSTYTPNYYVHFFDASGKWLKAHGISGATNKILSDTFTVETGTKMKFSARGFSKFKHKLERGTIRTDWTPAPEDVDNRITNVDGRIDNIHVGGTNLFKNTKEFDNPIVWSWGANPLEADRINGFRYTIIKSQWGKRSQVVAVEPDTEYTYSCWVKRGTGETSPTRLGVYTPSYDDKDPQDCVLVRTYGFTANETITQNVWMRVGFTVRTKPGTTRLYARIEPFTDDYQNHKPELYMYGLKLEKGNVMTDWSPNPDDIVADVHIGGRNFLRQTKDFILNTGAQVDYSGKYNDFTVRYVTQTAGSTVDLNYPNVMEFEPSEYYTLSYYAKSEVDGMKLRNYLYPEVTESGYNSTGNTTTANDGECAQVLTTQWKRYWVTWRTKPNISGIKHVMLARLHPDDTGSFNGKKVYVCGFKLEKGNRATDWTPAPEDSQLPVGGRNYFKTTTTIDPTIPANGSVGKDKTTAPNGFFCSSVVTSSCTVRIHNVITGNGYWTFSGYVKAQKNVTFRTEICDINTTPYSINATTEWQYFSVTSNVDRYSDAIYNFVDVELNGNSGNIYFKDVKIEKGNMSSDWTMAPEDTLLQIGGRNLAKISDITYLTVTPTRNKYTYTWTSNNASMAGCGLKINGNLFTIGKKYVVSYKYKKLSGNIFNMGGHNLHDEYKFMFDGQETGVYHRDGFKVPNDTYEHHVEVYFIAKAGTNDPNFYIQPNRQAAYSDYTVEVWDIKVEEGNSATGWSPAPEDVDGEISTIQSTVNTINSTVTNIVSDSKITPSEKQFLFIQSHDVNNEKTTLAAQTLLYGLTGSADYTNYINAFNTLSGILSNAVSDMSSTSTIDGAALRTDFSNYYAKRDVLNQAIERTIKSSLGRIDEILSDNIITPNEKQDLFKQKQAIDNEKTNMLAMASRYGADATAFTNAYNALVPGYIDAHGILSNLSVNTDLGSFSSSGNAFRTLFVNYYSQREALTNRINELSHNYINDAVKNIDIGGRNLVRGSSDFRIDETTFKAGWQNIDNFTMSQDTDGYTVASITNSDNVAHIKSIYSNYITAKPGEKFVISYLVKSPNWSVVDPKITAIYEEYEQDAYGTGRIAYEDLYMDSQNSNKPTLVNNEWVKYSCKMTVKDAKTKAFRVRLILYKNGEVHFKQMKIERGTIATDWSQAPEDTQTDLDSKINVGGAADDVNSGAQQIDHARLNIEGAITYSTLASELSMHFEPEKDSHGNITQTLINGGNIVTNSIKASSLNANGLTVFKKGTTIQTFNISDLGEVTAAGTFRSYDFLNNETNISASKGWQISSDGNSVFNNTLIRGKVVLPSAGLTNDYDLNQTVGRNLLHNGSLVANSSTINSYDEATRTYTLTAAAHAGDVWGCGFVVFGGAQVHVPYGETYCLSFEVKVPKAMTWNNDVNNFPTYGDAWASNDNDNGSLRKQSDRNLSPNVWNKCWFTYTNTHPSNALHTPLRDESNFGIVMKDETAPIQFQIRNVKAELGFAPTAWSPAPEDDTNPVRFWAGTSYENNKNAPFRVLQDGTIFATKGYLGGTFTGRLKIGNIEIADTTTTRGALTIAEDANTSNILARIGEDETYFKTNVSFKSHDGNTFAYFDSNNKELNMRPLSKFSMDFGSADRSIMMSTDNNSSYLLVGTSKISAVSGNLKIENTVADSNLNLTIGSTGKGTLTVHGETSIDEKLTIGTNVQIKKTDNGIGFFIS